MSQPEGTQPPNPGPGDQYSQTGQPAPTPYAPGQYPPAQYPSAQYPSAQYPPVQYPQGAYPQSQPAPGPYTGPYAQTGQPAQQYPSAYGQQPYGAYGQPYPTTSYPGAPVKAKKSPVLGIVALAVVAMSLIVGIFALQPVMAVMASVIAQSGLETVDQDYLAEVLVANAAGPAMILNIVSLVGFAGFVTGIVAIVVNRGRLWGVLATVLGILAPIVLLAVMLMALMPYAGA